MDLAVTGNQILMATIAVVVAIVGSVFLYRRYIASSAKKDLAGRYAGKAPAYAMKKYPEADVFRLSGTFLRLGLVVAIGMSALAFAWTQYDEVIDLSGYTLELPDDIEVETPRTAEPPPPPPPPPPPVIEEVPDDEIEEDIEFEDLSVDEDDLNLEVELEDVEAEPEPPEIIEEEPEPEPEIEEIFQVVEQMPRFPGCEDLAGNDAEKAQCAEKKLLEFIYKNIKYPSIARENGVEGMVVVRFVVGKDGGISEPKILRDIGAGCGDEALRVVNLMNGMPQKWTPGRQRNQPVKVQYNLPVRFKLEQ